MNKCLIILILLLCFYRLSSIPYSVGDDSLYNNAGRLLMQGVFPNIHYMFAHPPLFLLLAPFSFSIVGVRVGLLLTQIIILYFVDLILSHKGKSELQRLLIEIMIVFTPSFNIFFNDNTGFGLTVMWILISYYCYLKGKFGLSVFFAGVSCLTRFFALFYVGAMFLMTFKSHKFNYLLALIPIVILFLIPVTRYDLFLYHVDPSVGKGFMFDSERINLLFQFICSNLAFLPFILLPDFDLLIITVALFGGLFMMSNVFFMYFSLISVFLIMAVTIKLDFKQLLLLLLFSLVVNSWFNVRVVPYTIGKEVVYDFVSNVSGYGLPISGASDYINLAQFVNHSVVIIGSVEEPYGILDTLWHRWRHNVIYFQSLLYEQDHLFMCMHVDERYFNECNLTDLSKYEYVRDFGDLTMYKYEVEGI